MDSVSREAFRSVTLWDLQSVTLAIIDLGRSVSDYCKLIIDTGVTFNAKIRLYFWLCLGG